MTATEQTVRDNFYEAFHLMCLKYKMTEPIILYGRLFEEEQFQYVSVSLFYFILKVTPK